MHPYLAEFIGTATLILFGNGVNANVSLKDTYAHQSGWIVIALGWGMAVFVGVFFAAPYSGAHLNPAVSIGLAISGKFEAGMLLGYVAAQLAGAFVGAMIVYVHFRPHFKITEDAATKLGIFSTGPAIADTFQNLISEIIGTFALVFAIFYLVGSSGLGSLDALPVALLVVGIGLSLGGTTGYAINPARDFGPRLFHAVFVNRSSNWSYSWIPIVGPIIGAALAAGLYLLLN